LFAAEAEASANDFARKQGYSAPVGNGEVGEPLVDHFLKIGRSKNEHKLARLDEQFWGTYFDEINKRWLDWRATSGN